MSGQCPRIVLPGLTPEFTTLRNRVEDPHAFSGTRIESLYRSWRIVFVLQSIRDAAADNHQVFVNNRRRALPHLDLFVVVPESLPEHNVAALAKTADQLTRSGVDREETIVAVHENARLVTLAPERNSAVLVVEVNAGTVQVGLRIEAPQLFASFRVQRDDAVERRTDVQHVVDHERGSLKISGLRLIRLWQFLGAPLPHELQPVDIRRSDICRGGILCLSLRGSGMGPLNHLWRALCGQ